MAITAPMRYDPFASGSRRRRAVFWCFRSWSCLLSEDAGKGLVSLQFEL
jgi:hypothetical protein